LTPQQEARSTTPASQHRQITGKTSSPLARHEQDCGSKANFKLKSPANFELQSNPCYDLVGGTASDQQNGQRAPAICAGGHRRLQVGQGEVNIEKSVGKGGGWIWGGTETN
jgi:hypothetical protein